MTDLSDSYRKELKQWEELFCSPNKDTAENMQAGLHRYKWVLRMLVLDEAANAIREIMIGPKPAAPRGCFCAARSAASGESAEGGG